MSGQKIGEETLDFRTFSPLTANYVVHQAITIWQYQQSPFTAFVKRRSDTKKGKKPWGQKGSGKARHGSKYSPLFGRSATNKAPHGLDNKRKKKLKRLHHYGSISTVLQSKWRCMCIINGLEDWKEARQQQLEDCLYKWTGVKAGSKSMLVITRNGFGAVHKEMCMLTPESYNSPLYLSSRHIPRLALRRPRDIDVTSDGLFQCLKARRVVISREAFFDLKEKYGRDPGGWAFLSHKMIYLQQIQKLAKEFPADRAEEIDVARTVPRSGDLREFWAKEQRAQRELEEAS